MNIKNIETAVISFYRSGSQQQQETHEWLTQIQSSPQAWSFCWELMMLEKPSEIQFFGAITLHSKLTKYWHEVPKEAHLEFKQKLLETIILFGNGPKIVLSRLCISLSAFVVHMLKYPTVIEEVMNMFLNEQLGNLSKNTQIEILMEVLEGIPEEADTIHLSTPKAAVREELNKKAFIVAETIVHYINGKLNMGIEQNDMNGLLNSSKCAGAWLKYGNIRLDECEKIVQTLLNLIHYCYWKNKEENECLPPEEGELAESCLKTLVKIMTGQTLCGSKYTNTILRFVKLFLDILTPIVDAEWKDNNENENLTFVIYTLFLSTLECYSSTIFTGIVTEDQELNKIYIRTVDLIMKCTNKPGIYPVEESCSTLAMEFWYMLQEEVFSMDTSEHKSKCLEAIKPVYAHLVKILIKKSQMPNEKSIDKWNSDDLETFRCYRQDISDTLLSCHDVLNDGMLDVLSEALDTAILCINYDAQNMKNWPLLEATIHAFCAIAQKIEYNEHPQIVKLLRVLNEIPYEKYNDKLLGTALETIGAYSDWIGDNPKYLPSAINLLVKGLNSSQASQATLGLKDLTSECQKDINPYAIPLLDACQQTLSNGCLKNAEMIRLMYSVGNILSVVPYENIILYLDAMVSPCFEELQILVQNCDTRESARLRVNLRLEMISKLFSSLNLNKGVSKGENHTDMQPIRLILEKTMPLLKNICSLWIHNETVIETLCRALQQALSNLLDDIKPLLNDMCCLIMMIFQNKCAPAAVEIAGNFMLMFYNDQECRNSMTQLFTEIINYNFTQMELFRDKLSDISDLIEMFYMFNTKITKKMPACYSDVNVDCTKLVNFAMKSMMLPENGAMRKSVSFITMFTKESRNYPLMTNTILMNGEKIVRTALLCIGGLTPRTQVDVFADIFLSLNFKYPSEFLVWMKVLETPNFPTGHVSVSDKDMFTKKIIKEKVNKRLVQDHIRKFAALGRNIIEQQD